MKKYLILLCFLPLLCACKQEKNNQTDSNTPPVDTRKRCNAIYYWKTTFKLSDEERQFLADNHVERLYLRYFDVYNDPDYADRTVPVPEATLQFRDAVPANLEVVPTVFIDNQLFNGDMSGIPALLVERIFKMTETNGVPNVNEIQLDCDWTKSTEKAYFGFLKEVRKRLDSTIILSATIRLHQLRMPVPPVDRGVLMCYNTGGVRNPQTNNSILSASDVALYSKNVKDYALPLDVAYSTFSWAVWFHNDRFQALLRTIGSGNENLSRTKDNRYTVKTSFYHEGKYLETGDEIRFETSDFTEIIKSKKLLEPELKNYSVILYHLDNNNLSKYTQDEITQILAH